MLNGTWRFSSNLHHIRGFTWKYDGRYFYGINLYFLCIHQIVLFVPSEKPLIIECHPWRSLSYISWLQKSQINVMCCQYRFQNATWCSHKDWNFFKSKDQLLFILLLRFYVGKTFLEFTLNRHVICSISQQAYNGKKIKGKQEKLDWK